MGQQPSTNGSHEYTNDARMRYSCIRGSIRGRLARHDNIINTQQGVNMGWKSDWLYRLIFDEAARLWAQAQQDGAGSFGPAPNRFYIQQCADVQLEQLVCQPPILRIWMFDGQLPPALFPMSPLPTPDRTVRGMFYADGIILFHLMDDRKRIVWNHWLGRRYGRGKVLRVQGQGRAAILDQDPAFGEWVS